MTNKEIIARWLNVVFPNLNNYNTLHKAWIKFRDLKFNAISHTGIHLNHTHYIGICILYKPIDESFDELVKGIEWYESIKK